MMRSFDNEEWEMFEQNDLREGTFPEGSVWRPVGKVVMVMRIVIISDWDDGDDDDSADDGGADDGSDNNDHVPLKIMEDAMRKDLVLVPTSLLPGD